MNISKHLVVSLLAAWVLVGALSAQDNPVQTNPAALSPEPAAAAPKHSVDIDIMASWSYKQTFGLNAPESRFSYAPMLTYSYLLDENSSIGIVLLKFNHFALTANPVYNFAYGFQFRHSWHREWADLGIFDPWMSYGILLNWTVVNDQKGSTIGHDTRMALGTDLILAPAHRLVLQLVWDNVSSPSFGTDFFNGLGSLSFGLGYRFLF